MIYAVTFYLIAMVAAPFAFGGGQGTIVKVLFFVALGSSVVTGLVAEVRGRRQSPP